MNSITILRLPPQSHAMSNFEEYDNMNQVCQQLMFLFLRTKEARSYLDFHNIHSHLSCSFYDMHLSC